METANPGLRRARPARTKRRNDAEMADLTAAIDGADIPGKWSGRRTLLFILAVCGGFWVLVGLAFALFRHGHGV